jgi:hypothetical protein
MARKNKKDDHQDGIRRRRSVDISCQFCATFQNIPTDYRDPKSLTRHCKAVSKEVYFTTEACDSFDISQYFWCEPLSFQSSPAICMNRLHKGLAQECYSCVQGAELYRYLVAPSIQINIVGEE